MKTKYSNNASNPGFSTPDLTDVNELYDNAYVESLPISEGVRQEMLKERELRRKYHIIQRPSDGRWYAKKDGKQILRRNYTDIIKAVQECSSVRDIWDDFIEYRKDLVSPQTLSQDIAHYRDFISKSPIVDKYVKDITIKDLEELFILSKDIKGGIKKQYWKNILGTLSQVIQYAIKTGEAVYNPVKDLDIPINCFIPKTHKKSDKRYFLTNEKERVIKSAYQYAEKHSDSRALGIVLLFMLGLRIGELAALKWSDIEGGSIHIQRESVRDENSNYYIVEHTKTPEGDRFIPLNSQAKHVLMLIKQYNALRGFPDEFIFYQEYEKRVYRAPNNAFDKRLRLIEKDLDFVEIKSLHDIRRTFATELYRKCKNVKTIQHLMGHADEKETMRYIQFDVESDVSELLEMIV